MSTVTRLQNDQLRAEWDIKLYLFFYMFILHILTLHIWHALGDFVIIHFYFMYSFCVVMQEDRNCGFYRSWTVLFVLFIPLILFAGVLCVCRSLTCWGIVLGLISFISNRIWFTSFVPAWWDTWSNSAVIAVSAVATVDKIFSGENFFQHFFIWFVSFIAGFVVFLSVCMLPCREKILCKVTIYYGSKWVLFPNFN